MKKTNVQKLTTAALLCAVAVVGSLVVVPVFGSKCAPVQHMVNVLCAVLLGPWYGVWVAFAASLIRNLFGLGSLMAFPESMFGALLCGIAYWKIRKIFPTLLAEVFGTAVCGMGLCGEKARQRMTALDGNASYRNYIIDAICHLTGAELEQGARFVLR